MQERPSNQRLTNQEINDRDWQAQVSGKIAKLQYWQIELIYNHMQGWEPLIWDAQCRYLEKDKCIK